MNNRFVCKHCRADFGKIEITQTKIKGKVWYCPICEKENRNLSPSGQQIGTKSITAEAEEIINGDRRQSYGEVKDSFARFSLAWTGYLRNKLKPGEEITPNDVAMMNVIGKALREGNAHRRDNQVDIIGYTLLSEKLTS